MKLKRLFDRPLLVSRVVKHHLFNPAIDFVNFEHWWEVRSVFNPGAIFNKKEKNFYLLYRAQDFHFISRFGLAIFDPKKREIVERPDLPVFELLTPEELKYGRIGCEDPRLVYLEDEDAFMITYVSATIKPIDVPNRDMLRKDRPYGWYNVCTRNLTTVDFSSFKDAGLIFRNQTLKDVAFFPKKIKGYHTLLMRFPPSIQLAFTRDLDTIDKISDLIKPRSGYWDSEKVGIGPPPIFTEKGWLCIYHGVNKKNVYSLGYFILDLYNPSKVLYRSRDPILEPKLRWEKKGNTPNVVFSNGADIYNDQLYVFYGAADTAIGVASAPMKDFFNGNGFAKK